MPARASMPTIWPSAFGWERWSCPSSRGSPADVTGEIGDLIAGKVPGRLDDSQTTIFDATGLYILDLAAAKVAIDLAQSAGIGLEVDL